MKVKSLIKNVIPKRLMPFFTGTFYIATHAHHFLPDCFTLVPIKELFVILGGHERTPKGSEELIKKFFKIIEETPDSGRDIKNR
jgi:hypothetical protein